MRPPLDTANPLILLQHLPLHPIPHISRNIHKLRSPNRRQNMPPTMKLKHPRKRQSNRLPHSPQLSTIHKLDIPQQVPKQRDINRVPTSPAPILGHSISKSTRRLQLLQQIMALEPRDDHAPDKHDNLVNNIHRQDVHDAKDDVKDGECRVDGTALGRGLDVSGEYGVEHGPAETDHGELVDELERLAHRGVEEE